MPGGNSRRSRTKNLANINKMAKVKGQKQYEKFKEGKPLTRREAILAQCYVCNGEEEGVDDCKGFGCPLYQFHANRGKKGLESGSFMDFQDKEKGIGIGNG